MRWYSFIALLLVFNAADSTFWSNDFEPAVQKGSHKGDLSQDYLRALSIFKRKLQLLGFYPIVLNDDDGPAYASVDRYLMDDGFDDRMYDLLKKMKKEKKARKKSLTKKLKKWKKTSQPPIAATTVQPISNIVYYWPSTITTIVHPVEGTFGKLPYDNEAEENSSKADSISNNQKDKNGKQKPAHINYETSFSFERKLKFDDDDDTPSITSMPSTPTTTPYPLITFLVEDVAIEEILSQQDFVNKIDEDREGNITKIAATEEQDHVHPTTESSSGGETIQDNSTQAVTIVYITDAVPIVYEESARDQKEAIQGPTLDAKKEENISEEISPTESTIDITSINVTESSTYSSLLIPTGVLEFFHDTLRDTDEQSSSISPSSSSEIVPVPVSNSQVFHISDEVAETSENHKNVDGHRETGTSDRIDAILQIIEETTTNGAIIESLDRNSTAPNSSNDKVNPDSGIAMPIDHDTDGYEYSIDPKISLPMEIDDDFESRSLMDKPALIVILNDKSGRRADVAIEADDVNDEDTTDNLPYNLTNENVLEQSSVIENNSAETSTPPSTADALNFDNIEQFDAEIIPLIPIIIKQMRQGNVSPEEMEILKNTFGQFWPFNVEEGSRENDSSEEMNPLLSEVLNSVNK